MRGRPDRLGRPNRLGRPERLQAHPDPWWSWAAAGHSCCLARRAAVSTGRQALPGRARGESAPTATRPTSLVPATEVFTTGMCSASSASKTLQAAQASAALGCRPAASRPSRRACRSSQSPPGPPGSRRWSAWRTRRPRCCWQTGSAWPCPSFKLVLRAPDHPDQRSRLSHLLGECCWQQLLHRALDQCRRLLHNKLACVLQSSLCTGSLRQSLAVPAPSAVVCDHRRISEEPGAPPARMALPP